MTTPPPDRVSDLARRGIRLVAAAALALVVAAVSAVASPGSDTAAVVQLVTGAVLVALGVWLDRGDRAPSAAGTTTLVAGMALVAVGAQTMLAPEGAALDRYLALVGGLFVAAGYALAERRLVTIGLLQWVVVLALPSTNDATFAHCVMDLTVPVPRLDPVLWFAVAAVVVGTAHRVVRRQVQAGRGFEITGAIALNVTLLFKAVELPGLESLCGSGDAFDEWWAVAGMAVALASALYGLVGRDVIWATTGVAALALHGLAGTVLTTAPGWALAAFVPLAVGLVTAERAGVPWPREPGYAPPGATPRRPEELFRAEPPGEDP